MREFIDKQLKETIERAADNSDEGTHVGVMQFDDLGGRKKLVYVYFNEELDDLKILSGASKSGAIMSLAMQKIFEVAIAVVPSFARKELAQVFHKGIDEVYENLKDVPRTMKGQNGGVDQETKNRVKSELNRMREDEPNNQTLRALCSLVELLEIVESKKN